MKPEEAIEVLSNELIVITDMIGYCKDFEKESDLALAYRVKRKEAHIIAISALKEIQLYKDNKLCLIPEDVYSRQCSELDAYKEIGTVEECREAVEKQTPKKCIKDSCPENCRWVTPKENSRNRRNTKYLTLNGITKCVSEWCETIPISPYTIYWWYRKFGRQYTEERIEKELAEAMWNRRAGEQNERDM